MAHQVTATPAPDKILRVRTAAETLGVSKSTIWRYAKSGKLTAVKLSQRVTGFRQSEVQALIAGGAQ